MSRRQLTYFLGVMAVCVLSGQALGQTADGLRQTVDTGTDSPVLDETDKAQTESQATIPSLLLSEPEPLPIKRKRIRQEPFAPQGLGTGGLRLYPVLGVGGIYSDNVGRVSSGKESDVGLRLRPSLRVESDWVRHSLNVNAGGDFIAYSSESDFDVTSGDVSLNSRIDIRRTSRLEVEGFYGATQVGAAESDTPTNFTGLRTDQDYGASVSWSQELGWFQTVLTAGFSRNVFGKEELASGAVQNNEDRNYTAPRLALRGIYGATAILKPFVEVAYSPRFHDEKTDRNALRRDSDGYEVIAGVAIDSEPIWSADLGISYQRRDFEDDALDTVNAVGLTGNATWRPSDLTRISLGLDTSIDETTSVTSAGTRNYSLDLSLAHDWRENVTLLAGLGIDYEEFLDGPDDVRYKGNLGVVYRFNPWLAWTASYDITYFDSGLSGSDFNENRISAGFEFRY